MSDRTFAAVFFSFPKKTAVGDNSCYALKQNVEIYMNCWYLLGQLSTGSNENTLKLNKHNTQFSWTNFPTTFVDIAFAYKIGVGFLFLWWTTIAWQQATLFRFDIAIYKYIHR